MHLLLLLNGSVDTQNLRTCCGSKDMQRIKKACVRMDTPIHILERHEFVCSAFDAQK